MAKPKRGKNIKSTPNWRGTCPACNGTGKKLLWIKADANNVQLKVCKKCGS